MRGSLIKKFCTKCNKETEHYQSNSKCKGCANKYCKSWYDRNRSKHLESHKAYKKDYYSRNKIRWRRNELLKKYGITLEEYQERLENQGDVCLICREANPDGRSLYVDHCHSEGVVRGLLCIRCNFAVGLMRDNPALLVKIAQYAATGGRKLMSDWLARRMAVGLAHSFERKE